jgi:hypothetical protein
MRIFIGHPPWQGEHHNEIQSDNRIIELVMHVIGPFSWLYAQLTGAGCINDAVQGKLASQTDEADKAEWDRLHNHFLGTFDRQSGALRVTDDWITVWSPMFYANYQTWSWWGPDDAGHARLPPPADALVARFVYDWLCNVVIPFIREM